MLCSNATFDQASPANRSPAPQHKKMTFLSLLSPMDLPGSPEPSPMKKTRLSVMVAPEAQAVVE
jgi:hypothetical protein